MEQEELMQFVQWLPSKVEEFQNKTPEEIVGKLNELAQTEDGMNTISGLINQFKQEQSAGMFKQGGKLAYLVNKFKDGGKTSQRKSDKARKEFHGVDLFEYGPNKWVHNGAQVARSLKPGVNQAVLPNGVGLRQITRNNITTSELVSPNKQDTLYIHNGVGGRVDSNIDDSGILGFLGLRRSSPVSNRYKELQSKFGAQKFAEGGETEEKPRKVTSKKGNAYTVDKADTTKNGMVIRRLVGDLGNGYFNVMEQYQKVNNPKDLRYHFFNNVDFDYLSSLRKNPKVFGPFELASKQDNGFSPLFIDGYDLNKK